MEPISNEFAAYIAAQEPEMSVGLVECLNSTQPAVAVRVNRRKLNEREWGGVFGGDFVPWCRGGIYLQKRPDFTHDVRMHQGLYYVQDASSMIVSHVVEALSGMLVKEFSGRPLRYLDACAAPGGKTTAAIDALPDGALVVANEFDYRRAEILKENVMKWGYGNVVVSRGDTAKFGRLGGMFDIVAADVPCSGEGMMRKDETARRQWSVGLVEDCARRQREIVRNLWGALRPGGYFIYSTCTFNRVENEENVRWLMEETGAGIVDVPVDAGWGIWVRDGMMHFLPTKLMGEGLFMAVLHKPDDGATRSAVDVAKASKMKKTKHGGADRSTPLVDRQAIESWGGCLTGDFKIEMKGEVLRAIPRGAVAEYTALENVLDVIYSGVEVGYVKGHGIVPSQGLAMSVAFRTDAVERCDVDVPTALAYLRREALGGFDAPKGPLLLMCGGRPLGFVNNLINRSNNLYPSAWRVLK